METGHRIALFGAAIALLSLYPTWRENNFFFFDGLSYRISKLSCKPSTCRAQIWVNNDGFSPQENVELQLPYSALADEGVKFSSKPFDVLKKGRGSVVNFGTLHPSENLLVELAVSNNGAIDDVTAQSAIIVASKSRLGTYMGLRDEANNEPLWFRYGGYFAFAYLGLVAVYWSYLLFFETRLSRASRLRRRAANLHAEAAKLEAAAALCMPRPSDGADARQSS